MAETDYSNLQQSDRLKLASKGVARPDGSYPISDQKSLDDAVRDWIRTGRSLAVKEWIQKRARQLDLTPQVSMDGK